MTRKDKPKKIDALANGSTAVPTTPASDFDSSAVGITNPEFSGDILKKLQQKIQDGMKNGKAEEKGRNSGQQGRKKKAQERVGDTSKNDRKDQVQVEPKGKINQAISRELREKKRGRDGRDASSNQQQLVKPTVTTNNMKETMRKGRRSKKSISDDELLKEILELGGTREDLDLVKDVDSDVDGYIESAVKVGKDLKGEVKKLMDEIGYNPKMFTSEHVVADEDLSEEGVSEDEGEGDEELRMEAEEEEGEEGEEEEEEEEAGQVIPEIRENIRESSSVSTKHVKGKLLFPPRPDWHAYKLPELPATDQNPSPATIQILHARGQELLEAENKLYSTTYLVKTSDRQFLSTIITSGTLSDKVSALTLICQESPLHTTKTFETLLTLSKKKSRSQAVAALAAIKDLLASGVVLPSDRKLKQFAKQVGLGSSGVTDLHLLIWTYEDWLKSFYFEVVKVLEGLCSDQLEFARSHAVGYVWELLKEKPEQEANLLRLLVNKLGDSDKKVSSKVSFLLLQLQQTHPVMKSIIINAIESEVLFRPGNSAHAKYYAIITLNQTIISSRELEVANKLLDLYFAVFTGLLSKSHQSDKTKIAPSKEALGIHSERNGKLSKKAKRRLEEAERQAQSNEEINAKLISAVLTGVNRAYPFSKINDQLFEKHVDTLFRITHSGNFNTSIQALMLIHQVSASKQVVSDRFYRTLYESLLDQRIITSSKQAMYLNLLFKALKVDSNLKRVKAFVKRLVQISTMHQPAFICGVFYLLSELETIFPSLRTMLEAPEAGAEDEEEVFRDVPDEGDLGHARHLALAKAKNDADIDEQRLRNAYDGRKRDPEFANADRSCLWEIIPFICHFHPSVTLYASRFLHKQTMPNKPDLSLHTLTHFLDRFVFRNPTTRKTTRGHSIMQPLPGAGSETKGMVLSIRGTGKAQQSVNSEQFWTKKLENIAPDEVFFHKYFSERGVASKDKKKGKKVEDSEEEEEEEEEIWNAMVGSRPELEADGDDVDMDDEDINDIDLSGMSDSDEYEALEDSGDSEDEAMESDGEGEENVISLDAAIAASKRKRKGATPSSDDDGSDDDPALGLEEEGSDIWATDDEDASVASDVGMDIDAAFARELETNSSGPAAIPTSKTSKKVNKGKQYSATIVDGADGEFDEDGKKRKKQKLKHLPTFASADDYAHLLSD